MKKFALFIGIISFFVLSSCGPSETELQTMLAKTIAAIPSSTPLPTYTPYPTLTPLIIIVTPTVSPTPLPTLTPTKPPFSPQQMTATGVAKTKEYRDLFITVSYKELRDYPNSYVGDKIKIKGRIMQVADSHTLLVYYAGTYDIFYVNVVPTLSGKYEDNNILIYGVGNGSYCYDTTVGGTNCVFKITCLWYE